MLRWALKRILGVTEDDLADIVLSWVPFTLRWLWWFPTNWDGEIFDLCIYVPRFLAAKVIKDLFNLM